MNDPVNEIVKRYAWMNYVQPSYWDSMFNAPIKKNYRISICTTCMGRLYDLKQTLIRNIKNNIDYKDIEFVLIDYNSNDGLSDWIKTNGAANYWMQEGVLNYYRTDEPKYYNMAHSRNIAFKVATGDIVVNVDADNYTNKGFADYVNRLANQQQGKAIFAKGKKMIRGRLGFYKKEFVELLGGYDENLIGYGSEDHDILHRAYGLGFTMMWFGGQFYNATGSKKHQTENYEDRRWKYTEKKNKMISCLNLWAKMYKANEGKEWGKAILTKNFTERIQI